MTASSIRVTYSDPRDADEATVRACLSLLDDEERDRNARFRFGHLRRDHAVAHALQRVALSKVGSADPRAWVFRAGEHGRPAVIGPSAALAPAFNLTHTDGMVAVATSDSVNVGVDAELVVGGDETLELAESHFAPKERDDLFGLPPAARLERFFVLWTLKESYIKARGLGLALPLDAFWFSPVDPPSVHFDLDRIDDRNDGWQFEHRPIGREHRIAVTAESSEAVAIEYVRVPAVAIPALAAELEGRR